jgi:hypothetical protein
MTRSDSDDDKTQSHVMLTNGTMVSHYRIVEKIGAGGMMLRVLTNADLDEAMGCTLFKGGRR